MQGRQEDEKEAEARAKDLRRRFTTREMFIGREHDTLFSYVGEPVTSCFAEPHVVAWVGFEIATYSRWSVLINGCES